MSNPWLEIPASDYECHMGDPNVDQLRFLGEAFKESLAKYDSNSVALLGCATGNGLEYVDNKTKLLTAIDFNPEYLQILQQRYQKKIPGLNVVEANLEKYENDNQAYSLIFAGLLYEYLDSQILLPKITGWLRPEGVMVAILQLPGENQKKITETSYNRIKLLDKIMHLISPQEFQKSANEAGLHEIESQLITLKTGKCFYFGAYGRIE